MRAHHSLQNLDVYVWKFCREQVLGAFAEGTVRFREDHDAILCDGLLFLHIE
jgi:hypothetical protein